MSFFKTFSCADFSVVVVNKTFLGHPQQSLVFAPKFNSSKNPPQTPFKFPQSSHKSDFSKTRQIHQTHLDLLDLTKNFVGGVSAGNWGRFLWENEGLLRMSQKCFIDNYSSKTNKYQVASTKAKNKEVECTVNKSYVSCRCPSFKFDSVCKHSIAVAEKVGILEQHIQFIFKPSTKAGPRSALAEANVNKEVAGKKGGKNKYPYRPSRSQQEVADKASGQGLFQSSTTYTYNEIHHNDNPFVLRILPKNAKTCKQCKTDFCHRLRIIPNDLVFEHQERFYFPLNGDWKQKQASAKEAIRYYHADLTCMKARFPYFAKEYIAIPPEVSSLLHESHKTYLNTHFGLQL